MIVALSEKKRDHVPYRNSILTSVLRDSLGGNSVTSMITTVSLDPKNIQGTDILLINSQAVEICNDVTIIIKIG